MGQLRFSPAAAHDLDKIIDDISEAAGRRVALAFVDRMRRSLEHLSEFPRMGRRRQGFGTGVRSWSFSPYVAFYRPIGSDAVEIIRIVHGRRRTTRIALGGE